MDKKNDNKRFMVVAIRQFSNGEHHWLAPESEEHDDPFAFNAIEENAYGKPVFGNIKDAEGWAVSLLNGEWVLAQWETSRPVFLVVEESVYHSFMDREEYPYPAEAEEWSDAKSADFERECDIDEFRRNAVWDSDSDEEYVSKAEVERIGKVIERINSLEGLSAWREDEYIVICYMEKCGNNRLVADAVEAVEGFPREKVEWVKSSESDNTVYYKVK